MNQQFKTPIAFFIFKRPEETARVFGEIRKIRPEKLLVVADGGRNNEEWEKCNFARAVLENIDWPCQVHKNFSDKNLGCKTRVSSGIDWVFANVEEAIILEDDTVPNQTFFKHCEELLERYRNNNRLMHISGDNFQQKNANFKCKESYYFSRIPNIWGWATWRRAWNLYDLNMNRWPEFKDKRILYKIFRKPAPADYWEYRFSEVYANRHIQEIDTWDAQWVFACLLNNGLAINPRVNLVTNIGVGPGGVRAEEEKFKRLANLPAVSMSFPLTHAEKIEVNEAADAYSHWFIWGVNRVFKQKLISFLKFNLPGVYIVLKKIYRKILNSKS